MPGTVKQAKKNQANHSSENGVGFLLLDSSLKVIYANTEAIQALAYPKTPQDIGSLDNFLTEKIRSFLFDDSSLPRPTELVSGKRRYFCRTFAVDAPSKNPSQTTAVLVERSPRASFGVAQVAADFHLTERERQAVEFLLQGLTTKAIAERMKISPNTVKAFIRLVMVKMSVSSRSAILARIVQSNSRGKQE